MQKRVAIARAIVNNPKYLFCDETNSGLDPKTAIVIDNLIKEITEEYNITTVINTHDMNSVMEIGEKIIFLKKNFGLFVKIELQFVLSMNIKIFMDNGGDLTVMKIGNLMKMASCKKDMQVLMI